MADCWWSRPSPIGPSIADRKETVTRKPNALAEACIVAIKVDY